MLKQILKKVLSSVAAVTMAVTVMGGVGSSIPVYAAEVAGTTQTETYVSPAAGTTITVIGAPQSGTSISINKARVGETYKVYKVFDASVSGTNGTNVVYTQINQTYYNNKASLPTGFTAAADGSISRTGSDEDALTADEISAIKSYLGLDTESTDDDAPVMMQATVAAEKVGDDDATNRTLTFLNLPYGYYYITTTVGTAVVINTTNTTRSIDEKNELPTVDKKVKEQTERNGSGGDWQDTNDDQIGKTVEFKSTVKIPKSSRNVVYHDTMSTGLTWDGAEKVVVYTDDGLTTALTNTSNANYTVAAGTSPETFTVTFTQTYLDSLEAETTLYIGYSATLNNSAKITDGETNTAKVTYGDAGETEEVTTTTYSSQFQIYKWATVDNVKTRLAGAHFKLYTDETASDDDHTVKLAKSNTDEKVYRVYTGSVPDGYTAADDIVTVADGNITIEGVDSDNYWLEETQQPQGYKKLTSRQLVAVGAHDADVVVKEIENTSGNALPGTGGAGTRAFYIIGAMLVAAAAVLLISKRRKA